MKPRLPSNMRRPGVSRLVLVGGCKDERVELLERGVFEERQAARSGRPSSNPDSGHSGKAACSLLMWRKGSITPLCRQLRLALYCYFALRLVCVFLTVTCRKCCPAKPSPDKTVSLLVRGNRSSHSKEPDEKNHDLQS